MQHVELSRDTVVYDEGDIGTEMCKCWPSAIVMLLILRARLKIIRNAHIKNVGKSVSCMFL